MVASWTRGRWVARRETQPCSGVSGCSGDRARQLTSDVSDSEQRERVTFDNVVGADGGRRADGGLMDVG